MGESASYEPYSWSKGESMKDATRDFDKSAGRRYAVAKAKGIKKSDVLPDKIKTKSTHPIVIIPDLTGSMGDRPGIMFGKMGYLYSEIENSYFGKDAEVCFLGVKDSNDDYPLQGQKFAQGEDLRKALESLLTIGNGGSGEMHRHERYDAAALYAARNIEMPRAIRPTLIFIGDEEPYPSISVEMAEQVAKVKLEKQLALKAIFEELMRKFEVYFILCPYMRISSDISENIDEQTREIQKVWQGVLGRDRVFLLTDAARVVDVLFGIFGIVSGKMEYFENEIKKRQKPGQVKTVMTALGSAYGKKPAKAVPKGASKLIKSKDDDGDDAEALL